MTALSITAASVIAGSGAVLEHGTAGATVTAGQPVYVDDTTGKYLLADTNSATAAARKARGIALHASLNGQPLTIQKAGKVAIGATVVPGVVYYLGGAAGAIVPVADLTTGDYPCTIGQASSATELVLNFNSTGAAL
jgi:hypothetical protein